MGFKLKLLFIINLITINIFYGYLIFNIINSFKLLFFFIIILKNEKMKFWIIYLFFIIILKNEKIKFWIIYLFFIFLLFYLILKKDFIVLAL